MNKDSYNILTEIQGGERVGRDPRKIPVKTLNEMGIIDKPLLTVIREKCLDCCCGNQAEVKMCTSVSCPLWVYRMNTNPLRKREISEEQRLAMAERLKNHRLKK